MKTELTCYARTSMRLDKERVMVLRKSGKSYNEINTLLGIPKSTLSEWLRNIRWSQRIKIQLSKRAVATNRVRIQRLNRLRHERLQRAYEQARKEAKEEFEEFKLYPLFIAGISIYWGEGDKTSKSALRVGNTDPLLIRLFVKFLRDVCGITKHKIRASVLLYPDLNQELCERFWIKNSGLSRMNFNKSVIIQGRHKTRRLPYGVCTVNVTSSYLKEKMMVWLKMLPKELIIGRYMRE